MPDKHRRTLLTGSAALLALTLAVIAGWNARPAAPTSANHPRGESAVQHRANDGAIAAAFEKAYIEGDIDGAIRLSEGIVTRFAEADREIAARTLVLLGDLHLLKSDGQATHVFRRILTEYPDQLNEVSSARMRLDGLWGRIVW